MFASHSSGDQVAQYSWFSRDASPLGILFDEFAGTHHDGAYAPMKTRHVAEGLVIALRQDDRMVALRSAPKRPLMAGSGCSNDSAHGVRAPHA